MRMIVFTLGLLCAFSLPILGQSKAAPDPLKPFTKCKPGDNFEFVERVRYVGTSPHRRDVKTSRGAEEVSVVDGYHIAFRFEGLSDKFASVKIEQSDPSLNSQNKDVIISNLEYLSTSDQRTPIAFTDKSTLNGFEHYGVDRDRIGVGEVIGTHVLFKDRLTVTLYFLNPATQGSKQLAGSGRQRFANLEEYRQIRDKFLTNYSECLQGVAIAQK